ncbi:hypothetical protein GCM10022399_37520 [Terrabacter ginsenosidimutans]|uniref:D-inositol 3-phosphate glycosyltransferase n=1 Tax=Terrabacter ginsenosidimutans TaxID=490575 RepID=A0ABP7EEI6_9MICO
MALDPNCRINHFSESAYGPKGHGVETAFRELVSAQRRLGRQVQTNATGHDGVLHVHTIGPMSALRLVRHQGLAVASAHITLESLDGSVRGERRARAALRRYMRNVYSSADLVLAVSRNVRAELESLGVTAPIELLPNGIDPTPFEPTMARKARARAALRIGADQFVVLGVGQLQPRKGIAEFLSCARHMREDRFLWVGSALFGAMSASRGTISRAVRDSPPNVTFVGQVPREEIARYYHAADVFLLPSRHETFGLAAVEAGIAGLPLVLWDIPAASDVFGHVHGACATARDTAGLVREIRALKKSPEARHARGAAAREASLSYGSAAVATRSLEIYAHAVEAKRIVPGRY